MHARQFRRIVYSALWATLAGVTTMCAHTEPDPTIPFQTTLEQAPTSNFTEEAANRLRQHLPSLGEEWSRDAREDYESYRNHWQFALDFHTIAAGSVDTDDGEDVFVQILSGSSGDASEQPVVFFIHGYLDHTATNRYAIEALLEHGATVITMDLPGHGLSSGRRAHISDFSLYGSSVEQVLEAIEAAGILARDSLRGMTGIGHSTGATALLEHTENYDNRFSRFVFAAPLIRVFAFPILQVGAEVVGQMVDQLPDRISGSTSNESYIDFAEQFDVLRVRHTDLEWFEAYLEWEESRRDLSEREIPLLLVLAEDDTVVANGHNEEFLRRVFPDTRVIEVEDARHSIFTEPAAVHGTVMAEIVRFALDQE